MNEVAKRLNDYFVNVGPKLAIEIQEPGIHNDNLIDRNSNSIFLKPVVEKEIIDIANICKNKTSTDYNDIDMKTVKKKKSHSWDFQTVNSHL